MTMEQLFVRLLYEDWNAEKYSIRAIDKKDEAVCVKGSYEWFHDLEAYCAAYENSVIPTKEVRIEKNNVLLLEAERISSYLKEHPQLSMQEKINMLTEIQLSKLENELIGKWKNDETLIISDNEGAISFVAGREKTFFKIILDTESRLEVSSEYEGGDAFIKGNVSTIEVKLKNRKGV